MVLVGLERGLEANGLCVSANNLAGTLTEILPHKDRLCSPKDPMNKGEGSLAGDSTPEAVEIFDKGRQQQSSFYASTA